MADDMIDASDLAKAIRELDQIPERIKLNAHAVVETYAENLRDKWRSNARTTARRHGKHYPRSITASPTSAGIGDVSWEVGPESALPQGGMGAGFEYGGPNQPPHLDGDRAARVIEPLFLKAVEDMIDRAL